MQLPVSAAGFPFFKTRLLKTAVSACSRVACWQCQLCFVTLLLLLTDTVHLYYTVMYNILKVPILIAKALILRGGRNVNVCARNP